MEHAGGNSHQESGSGREIEGLNPTEEHFSPLEEGTDYTLEAVNPHISSRFDIRDFFIFVDPSNPKAPLLRISPPHWRTVDTPGITATLNLPNITQPLYVANTKGVGYLKPGVKGKDLDELDTWTKEDEAGESISGYKVLGLSGIHEFADTEIITLSNQLATQGLRCEVYWGLARLLRVIYKGEHLPIAALKRRGVILNSKRYVPSQAVRLLKTNHRIEEAYRSDDQRRAIFVDAFGTFNRETRDQDLTLPQIALGAPALERVYFHEMARRLGRNSAVLINTGYSHFYSHSSNVTMAAEVVDIGTVRHYRNDKEKFLIKPYDGLRRAHIKDIRDTAYNLRYLLKAGHLANLSTGTRAALTEAFLDGFDQTLDPASANSQGTSPTSAKRWATAILTTVVTHRQNLPSLMYNQIEDWKLTSY